MSKRLLAIACLLGFWAVVADAQVEERTVIDIERGYIGSEPYPPGMKLWHHLGLYMGSVGDTREGTAHLNEKWLFFLPDAIKGAILLLLQHQHLINEEWDFPIQELLAFEREEVRQGRDPFFITATHEGVKRPVLEKRYLRNQGKEVQAVNITDDRYLKFWLKNFVRRWLSPHSLQNWGVRLDNAGFRHKYYIVVDDAGQEHAPPEWDEPFPQTEEDWANAAQYAFRRIKELAPDLIIICNAYARALEDESQERYAEVFEYVDGTTSEHLMYPILGFEGQRYEGIWRSIERFIPPNGADAYKIQIFDARIPDEEHVRWSYLFYLLMSGPNAFFGPRGSDDSPIVGKPWAPFIYSDIKNALGRPASFIESMEEPGKEPAQRLWWRQCQGGIVYLNTTGIGKVVTLPGDGLYYNPMGEPISVITLEDLEATYVTFEPGERTARPRINPRRPGLVTGPLTITLDMEPYNSAINARIVYTLDGSEPDEDSTVYTGPFEIYESCTVKAKAFDARHAQFPWLPSFTNFATYRLTDQEPTVEFHHASDNGSEFLEHDYPVVSLSHVSAHPVTIRYRPLGGTATQGEDYVPDYVLKNLREQSWGMLTIRPGEQHRYFYVHIVNDAEAESNETIEIAISDPVNATLGEKTIYTYTIEDNDHEPPVSEFWEDFETLPWEYSGDASWELTSGQVHTGEYSMRVGDIDDRESSTISVTLDCVAGEVSFWMKISSEYNCDKLRLYIDDTRFGQWSGGLDWQEISFPVEAGRHTFRWTYSKDESISRGSDTAWIDDIVFPIQVQELPPTSNLVAWWKLDEGSGTIAVDSSGKGHDGTAQATPEWVDGRSGYGKALYFDGSNPAPAWVNCGTWNPSAGTGQLTVALWVRWDGPVEGVWQGLIAKRDGGGSQGTRMMWDIFIHKDKYSIQFSRAGSYPPCGNRVLPIGQWSHVAATFDGTTMIFYIDGEETGRGDFSFGTKTDSTIIIGALNWNGGNGFHGALDDIRLYNNALSPAEIKSLAAPQPVTQPTSNLVAWWKFDEGMGTTALDWSGHGHHGTLEGDPQWVAGYDGGGLEFDGVGDFVDCGNVDTTDEVTVTAWIKWNGNKGQAIISKVTNPRKKDYDISIIKNGLQLWYESTGQAVNIESDRIIPTNEWTHIAIAFYTHSSGKMYINGVFEKSWNTTEDRDVSKQPVNIGRRAGTYNSNYFEGIIDNVRIYNKALTQAEIQKSMRGDQLVAWGPKPCNGSTPCIRDAMPLSWLVGEKASGHNVYFGTDRDTVANADESDTTGTYRGRQSATNYNPPEGVEWGGGPYYWRIDEYNTDATISKGRIWSFTVADFIVIEEFEDYNDYEPDRIFETWIDGWEVPTNGSMSSHFEPPFAEKKIAHGVSQSMPLYYDNNFMYSEATMTLVWPRDWTEEGVGVLSLWFYGDLANAPERMYVALNGSAAVYHDNPNAAQIATWTEWTIDLQKFAAKGVNLANINTISIGFGDKNNIQPGGSGLVFFDDIRLYRRHRSQNRQVDKANHEILVENRLESSELVN